MSGTTPGSNTSPTLHPTSGFKPVLVPSSTPVQYLTTTEAEELAKQTGIEATLPTTLIETRRLGQPKMKIDPPGASAGSRGRQRPGGRRRK